ncbi:MAG: NFACT family protein [Firmicutes bacterium]|nr:NFACT family protein [Bacillota bacterium]
MSLDGRFLSFLANELNFELKDGRIQKIYQLTKTDFLFMIRANQKNHQLSISLSTSLSRIHLTKYSVEKPDNPSGFCMLLRKYLEGGVIQSIRTLNSDRVIQFEIQNLNEIGDMTNYNLYMEIMGRYANLIVTDESNKLIDAYKHISPFEEKERTIVKGIEYRLPKDEKIEPDDLENAQQFLESQPEFTYQELIGKFRGFSPILSKFIIKKAKLNGISIWSSYKNAMSQPLLPTRTLSDTTQKFYYFDIFDDGLPKQHYSTLSELLDEVYLETSKIERMKQMSKNIYQLAKREFEKNKSKLEKLTMELDSARNSDLLRKKGDLIVQNLSQVSRGDSILSAMDYESEQTIQIELDRLLTPMQNANLYYKRYKKNKNAVSYIEKQIELTHKLILYFDVLITQIENASVSDLDEIKDELSKLGYIRARNKKNKKGLPNYDVYILQDGTLIYVGKNNIQNEYLTNKLAFSSDWWFHTKDIHGSHVIVKKNGELSEEIIRTAAMLAAYFSNARQSSSVPVDYTIVKYVKKIPGEIGSFVQYSNHKTIYIDPDASFVASLKKKKN